MQIEILTTKKKLSKSIVKQFKPASLGDLNQLVNVVKIGYHVRDLGKGYPSKVYIFEGINGWCIIWCRPWKKVSDRPFLECKSINGRGSSVKRFNDEPSCVSWLNSYNAAAELCDKNHLFI